MGKITITLDDLKSLSKSAMKNGTETHFISLVLEWAEHADNEIKRLATPQPAKLVRGVDKDGNLITEDP